MALIQFLLSVYVKQKFKTFTSKWFHKKIKTVKQQKQQQPDGTTHLMLSFATDRKTVCL